LDVRPKKMNEFPDLHRQEMIGRSLAVNGDAIACGGGVQGAGRRGHHPAGHFRAFDSSFNAAAAT